MAKYLANSMPCQAGGGSPATGRGAPELTLLCEVVPWGADALATLTTARLAEPIGECPLPELFGAVRGKHAGLTVRDFHDGLRRLADNRAIRLTPWAGPGRCHNPNMHSWPRGG